MEFLDKENDNRLTKEDILKQGYSIYGQAQIDQMILTPEARATIITKKVPRIIREPIYLLDEKKEKIPVKDSNGEIRYNELGEVMYVIKDYKETQVGWMPIQEIVPASEMFNVDNGTGNISHEAVIFLTKTIWRYNIFSVYQQTTDNDYSIYLHKLRNDALAILNASKSFNGGTLQAIKTFINKTDSKQWLNPVEEKKKPGILGGIFGGGKPKPKQQPDMLTGKGSAYSNDMNFL